MDDVSKFLQDVKEMNARRTEEDDARQRELDEKIQQEKRERQARRAERARSISPQKSSPANTPPPSSHRNSTTSRLADGPRLTPATENTGSPQSRAAVTSPELETTATDAAAQENAPPAETDEQNSSMNSPSSPSGIGGPRPLSWQRRPNSQAGEKPKTRPLSMFAAQNAARTSSTAPSEQAPASATEQTLTKDQIAQALGSRDPTWFRQTADRGLGSAAYRKNQVEDQETLDMSSLRAQLPGMERKTSAGESQVPPPQPKFQDTLAKDRATASPLRLSSAQRLDPPAEVSPEEELAPGRRASAMTSPTRSPSRSEAIESEADQSETPKAKTAEPSPIVPPIDTDVKEQEEVTPPSSPSKTMDPRRWSPTKASWLETALNKPESPKPKPSPAATNQPAWMVELNKAKAQKSGNPNAETGRSGSISSKHAVNIGGLMRSTPMGSAVKPSTAGLGGIYSPPTPTTRSGFAAVGAGSLRGNLHKPNLSSDKTEPETSPVEGDAPTTRSSVISPSSVTGKTRPATPPKKDFRANLKPRQASGDASAQVESNNELKNVFGNLRRTKTQNYVAPDELKGNILRGKAALNATGGPKPSERKDEFKDAILKKKEDFKKAQDEGKGVERASAPPIEEPIPEGIARRRALSRSTSGRADTTSGYGIETSLNKSANGPRPLSSLSKRDSAESMSTTKTAAEPVMPELHKETSAPARLQNRPSAGGLAGRFNQNLAGLLARGPPPMAANSSKSADDSDSGAPSAPVAEPSAPGPQLTHMTKGRARGPKRKAPTSAQPPAAAKTVEPAPKENMPFKPAVSPKKTVPAVEATQSPRSPPMPSSPSSSLPQTIQAQVAAKAAIKNKPSPVQPPQKPTPTEDPSVADVSQKPPSPPVTKAKPVATTPFGSLRRTPPPTKQMEEEPVADPASSPRKLDMKRMSRFFDDSNAAKPAAESPKLEVVRPEGIGRQLPKPESPRRELPNPSTPSRDLPKPPNIGQTSRPQSPRELPRPQSFNRELPKPESPRDLPCPLSINKPESPLKGQFRKESQPGTPLRSPVKQANEVTTMLDEFFGTSRPQREYRIDTADILMNRPQVPRVRTAGAQLFQLFGDGKKMPVPMHNERVLFEQEMYICPHEFTDSAGKKAFEVYFWAGDEVPASTLEDAQLFASREARALGGKLVKLQQGKETAEFLQALGGIVITRRGSSNKFDMLAPSILCGRRHLGQVAFDEVDFAPANLCAGFAYLITQQGKCYLWKGKGSNVDELSCARLIGMDLTLTGELIEVDDGGEPATFWDVFGGSGSGAKPHSADHWRLKPNYDKYCGRLFCSDAASRQQVSFILPSLSYVSSRSRADAHGQISEICPFSQADLKPSSVYILDAFFEMYIIVGRAAQAEYLSFRNALDFAQEYAILASGMEDRPFVPISTVVLEGIPRDLKRVFRKWTDDGSPTVMPQAGLKRGRSLRIVPLTQALQALSE
ncbi:advillin [Verticillium dahliae VdLs.17]|uniref:Advillin n=1 Tax=Verticillium dahliae (strain VdLs.17 / ATCC MYA-4575 / FGSC 10137) TaxID=498257 RepID=G2X1G1_VERDV|nr:advillin [Verticillium dahliae VdLs.17]EGY22134.1 advillin [Verticillium dahliae VdLs.17]KAH6704515.1 advillin [Verticillium dahliae]